MCALLEEAKINVSMQIRSIVLKLEEQGPSLRQHYLPADRVETVLKRIPHALV